MMKKLCLLVCIIFIGVAMLSTKVFATVGVGVGSGKIFVEDKLKPGIIYKLPNLTVLNTGDEVADYALSIAYHSKQPELLPDKNWFEFEPKKFSLDPGEARSVDIILNLPVKVEPGKYFAYLEARPIKISEKGDTSIGIAAAAKLYFEVIPASYLQGVYYKIRSYFQIYAPWPQRVISLVIIGVIAFYFNKYFKISIDPKNPKQKFLNKE